MTSSPRADLRSSYGPWALIAGASGGIGAEFARQLAAAGLNVILVARRAEALEELAQSLRKAHGVHVRTASIDLAAPDLLERIRAAAEGVEIGLLVYNAAYTRIGPFLEQSLEDKLRILDVNCRGPVVLAHELGGAMARRKRGGIILLSSIAGFQGAPMLAMYGATKSFDRILAEGLWEELRAEGIDVIACCAGATRTPTYEASKPLSDPAMIMETEPVVRETLAALGKTPSFIPGAVNRAAAFVMERLLPRSAAIRTMGKATRKMYGI
jgi:short-subunit dehydrogenase